MSSRLALGVAEVAIVEGQDHEPRLFKLLGEVVEVHFLECAEAVGYDDGRAVFSALQIIRHVQPAGAVQSLTEEGYVLSHASTPFVRRNVTISPSLPRSFDPLPRGVASI